MVNDVIRNVSEDRIFTHIQQLEVVRNPVTDPEALERAAEYIFAELSS